MNVILAGFNVETAAVDGLRKIDPDGAASLTPEVFSAAYARLSRSPKSAVELRREAREEIERARRSNKKIIFGMGHHSVAEHAVFNFDLMGLTRLAVEEVEHFRLASFTEKSQRYQRLDDAMVVPAEVKTAGLVEEFTALVSKQNRIYQELVDILLAHALASIPEAERARSAVRKACEIRAKEDARYVTSLSTPTQLGATFNARALELLFRRFASHPLEELKALGARMFTLVEAIAPSIILFVAANDYDRLTYPMLEETAGALGVTGFPEAEGTRRKRATLVDHTADADERLTAALLHRVAPTDYRSCLAAARDMDRRGREEVVRSACRHLELYDSVLREYEHVSLTYELCVSASCFAQLKRHRMATLSAQPYRPELGVEVPPSVADAGAETLFFQAVAGSRPLYEKMVLNAKEGAAYCLTNGHRRRVLVTLNARELYHVSRLREDHTAQWEIGEVARQMTEQARKVMPLTTLLACGKDRYAERFRSVYGHPPKIENPTLPGSG